MRTLSNIDPGSKSDAPSPEQKAWMDECDEADRQRELEYDRDELQAIERE